MNVSTLRISWLFLFPRVVDVIRRSRHVIKLECFFYARSQGQWLCYYQDYYYIKLKVGGLSFSSQMIDVLLKLKPSIKCYHMDSHLGLTSIVSSRMDYKVSVTLPLVKNPSININWRKASSLIGHLILFTRFFFFLGHIQIFYLIYVPQWVQNYTFIQILIKHSHTK